MDDKIAKNLYVAGGCIAGRLGLGEGRQASLMYYLAEPHLARRERDVREVSHAVPIVEVYGRWSRYKLVTTSLLLAHSGDLLKPSGYLISTLIEAVAVVSLTY